MFGSFGRNVRVWVFRLSQMVRFAPFFSFFFFEFRPDRPFRPIPADTDRIGPIWATSASISAASTPISAASARFGTRHVARRGTDARSAASLPRRRVGRRCAGLGAASVHPRLVITTSMIYAFSHSLSLIM